MAAPLSFNEYQGSAIETAVFPTADGGNFAYHVLGLASEAGELAGEFKKSIRDDGGEITEERRNKLISEAGDVLWYLAMVCSELDIPMSAVASLNLIKLQSRKNRGMIGGSGGER